MGTSLKCLLNCTPARKEFGQFLLRQPAGFENNVIWSDEKIFVRHMRLNKQNDRVWAMYNPREYRETKVNGDEKAMVWVGLVGGQIIARYWFLDPDNEEENISCNSGNYVDMLRNTVMPAIARRRDGHRLWFMQDGAPAHHSNVALSFLRENFGDRLIALGTKDNPVAVKWPPHSPDVRLLIAQLESCLVKM